MQLLYFIVLALLAFVSDANAGVFWRYQTSASPTLIDGGTDVTGSVTSNPAAPLTEVFVGVHWTESLGTDFTITCTYGGTAMTEIANTGAGPFLNVFKLANPPLGSQTVTATITGATGLTLSMALSVIGFTGAASTEGIANTSATSNAPTATVSPFTTGSAAVSFYSVDLIAGASTATVGAGETQRVNRTAGAGATALRALASTQDMGGDGIMNYSLSASRTWYESAIGVTAGGKPIGVVNGGVVLAP